MTSRRLSNAQLSLPESGSTIPSERSVRWDRRWLEGCTGTHGRCNTFNGIEYADILSTSSFALSAMKAMNYNHHIIKLSHRYTKDKKCAGIASMIWGNPAGYFILGTQCLVRPGIWYVAIKFPNPYCSSNFPYFIGTNPVLLSSWIYLGKAYFPQVNLHQEVGLGTYNLRTTKQVHHCSV